MPIRKRYPSNIMRTEQLAYQVLEALKSRHWTLSTAESCTGGGIGSALTAVPGSSTAYLGGVISYTNAVKHALLGVPDEILSLYGAVSRETAACMAEGVRKVTGSHLGVSVTGLAGPNSDGSGKPVGLVYIGCANEARTVVNEFVFQGDRTEVRQQAIISALELSLEMLSK